MSLGLGINVKGPRGPLGAGVVRLLDEPFASGATAAYSLRLLREAHVGGLIRSRADDAGTDKGEADVLPRLQPDGAKIIELNSPIENLNSKAQTRLGAPAGGGNKVLADLVDAGGLNFDGLTSKWYGQTPNKNDATQSNASEQPQIVNSGSVIQENGKPALKFDGFDDFLANNDKNITSNKFSVFSVNKSNESPANNFMRLFLLHEGGKNFQSGYFLGADNTTKKGLIIYQHGRTFNTNGGIITKQNLILGIATPNEEKLFIDGQFQNSSQISAGTTTNANIKIGTNSNANKEFWNGLIQEIILYTTDQSSNRTKIETNINNHYLIF